MLQSPERLRRQSLGMCLRNVFVWETSPPPPTRMFEPASRRLVLHSVRLTRPTHAGSNLGNDIEKWRRYQPKGPVATIRAIVTLTTGGKTYRGNLVERCLCLLYSSSSFTVLHRLFGTPIWYAPVNLGRQFLGCPASRNDLPTRLVAVVDCLFWVVLPHSDIQDTQKMCVT